MSIGVGDSAPAWIQLGHDEQVLVRAHTNQSARVQLAVGCGVAGAANALVALLSVQRDNTPRAIAALLWVTALLVTLIVVLARATDVAVTNHRVIVRGRPDMHLCDIQTVVLRQNGAGRRRDVGDVMLRGNGRRLTLRMITNAGPVQHAVWSASGGRADPAAPTPWSRIATFAIVGCAVFITVVVLN